MLLQSKVLTLVLAVQCVIGFTPKVSRSGGINKALMAEKLQDDTKKSTRFTKTASQIRDQSDQWITDAYNDDDAKSTITHPLQEKSASCVGPSKVLIYDTTLRDGTQSESISASCNDKLRIVERLSDFGVDYIEAGWPGSNPKDAEFFAQAPTVLSESAMSKLVAFGSTRRKGRQAKDDAQLQALLDAKVPTICLVAKGHAWQVTDILQCTLEENLKMIYDSVKFLVDHNKTVLVDLEHFFDGYNHSPDYALLCGEAAVNAGAAGLVLCDTNGGSMPWQVADVADKIVKHFNDFTSIRKEDDGEDHAFQRRAVTIGIHTHNDCGMAVANSLQACKSGIGLVQGTINGIGERTGNADLCSIVPSLALHVNSELACSGQLSKLTQMSRWVDEILNRTPNHAAPFVGTSAFAHKGGLHVAAMERSSKSYQHIEPELVGNEKRVLISELSGRQNIVGMLKDIFGNEDSESNTAEETTRAVAILHRVKELEHRGYTFEGAEASVHLMILHASKGYCPPFAVLDYSAQVFDHDLDSASRVWTSQEEQASGIRDGSSLALDASSTSRATVKVRTVMLNDGCSHGSDSVEESPLRYRDTLEVSDGTGPVDSLANALLRALKPTYPHLVNVELVDYKVRILDPNSATSASTRVMIEFHDSVNNESWTTVSVDRNIISASLNALIDGFEYALVKYGTLCMLCDEAYEIGNH